MISVVMGLHQALWSISDATLNFHIFAIYLNSDFERALEMLVPIVSVPIRTNIFDVEVVYYVHVVKHALFVDEFPITTLHQTSLIEDFMLWVLLENLRVLHSKGFFDEFAIITLVYLAMSIEEMVIQNSDLEYLSHILASLHGASEMGSWVMANLVSEMSIDSLDSNTTFSLIDFLT